MVDFGFSSKWANSAATLLPLVELGLSFGLLVDHTSRLAAHALGFLLLSFGVGIVKLLSEDRAPPCNCFGVVHSTPVGRQTLARTLCLSTMAFLVAFLETFSFVWGVARTSVCLVSLVVVGRILASGLQRRRLLSFLSRRLQVGQRLPPTRLENGEWVDEILSKDLNLLIVTSPDCGACYKLKSLVRVWAPSLSRFIAFYELTEAREGGASPDKIGGVEIKYASNESLAKFHPNRPAGLLVDRRGVLLQSPTEGAEQIKALVRVALSLVSVELQPKYDEFASPDY